jgi:hypothetical protein
MSNNNVTVETATATVSLDATQAAPKSKNATKQQAAALADIAMGFRKSKSQPSKVMTTFAADVAAVLMDDNDIARLKAAAERAKKAAAEVIEAQLQRALALAQIGRGTTGPGNINRDDVVVEVFTADKKSAAVERNTRALRATGRVA